jgi:hypothetical protein
MGAMAMGAMGTSMIQAGFHSAISEQFELVSLFVLGRSD